MKPNSLNSLNSPNPHTVRAPFNSSARAARSDGRTVGRNHPVKCAIRLHTLATRVNSRTRLPYRTVSNAEIFQLCKSYKVPDYDVGTVRHNHYNVSLEQDLMFLLLVKEASSEFINWDVEFKAEEDELALTQLDLPLLDSSCSLPSLS